MMVPDKNGEIRTIHLVGAPSPCHDPIVSVRARARSDMGEYKNKSRPRSRSTSKIPSTRQTNASPQPQRNMHYYDRKRSIRAASETMDKEDLRSSVDKGKKSTAPGS